MSTNEEEDRQLSEFFANGKIVMYIPGSPSDEVAIPRDEAVRLMRAAVSAKTFAVHIGDDSLGGEPRQKLMENLASHGVPVGKYAEGLDPVYLEKELLLPQAFHMPHMIERQGNDYTLFKERFQALVLLDLGTHVSEIRYTKEPLEVDGVSEERYQGTIIMVRDSQEKLEGLLQEIMEITPHL